MYEINFIDKSFAKDASAEYGLSVQVNSSGLTYCISGRNNESFILFRKHRFEQIVLTGDLIRSIQDVFQKDETLRLPFHHVRFMGYTQQSTLIPSEYYDEQIIESSLLFNYAGDVDAEHFSNLISPPGIYNLFALPEELVSVVKLHFPDAEFVNQTTPFLRHIASVSEPFMRPAVYLGLNPGFFDIACVGHGKLKLYNTFQYASENDLLYYVLLVYGKSGFDFQKIPLIISGELSAKLSYREILKQYISLIQDDELANTPKLSPGLNQLGAERFLNLLNLQMCVLSAEHTKAGI